MVKKKVYFLVLGPYNDFTGKLIIVIDSHYSSPILTGLE